jgi:hypothetical protein
MPETDQLRRALDHEFPPLADDTPDWDDVLRRVAWRRLKRRFPLIRLAAAAGIAALIALVATSPWQSERVGVLDRALAAVGDEPVLHVVLEQSARGSEVVDLGSGQPIVRKLSNEVWFDERRGLKKTISRIDGTSIDEMLETPEGGFTEGGVIYTCTWIAKHPVEAAKARVSCPGGSDSGGEQLPSVDPALSGFVDHYRAALASGEARRIRDGKIDGHAVTWIAFRIEEPGRFASSPTFESVAIDKATYRPLLISTGLESIRIREIETVPFDARLFSKPPHVERPAGGSVAAESEIGLGVASRTLRGASAVWLGEEWHGLRLTSVRRQELSTGYGPRSTREPSHAVGIELAYSRASASRPAGHAAVIFREATSCQPAYGWPCGETDPIKGTIELRGPISLLRVGSLYIAIWDFRASNEPRVLDLARALEPIPGG